MTALDLAALRKVAEAATPGEWDASCIGSEGYHLMATNTDGPKRRIVVARCTYEKWETDRANAEHIAAFHPATVLALLDLIESAPRPALCGQRAVRTEGRPDAGGYLTGACALSHGHTGAHQDVEGFGWIESVR